MPVIVDRIAKWFRNLNGSVDTVETVPGVWVTTGPGDESRVDVTARAFWGREDVDETPYERSVREAVQEMARYRRSLMDRAEAAERAVEVTSGATFDLDAHVARSRFVDRPVLYAELGLAAAGMPRAHPAGCPCWACVSDEFVTNFGQTSREVEDAEAKWLEILARETEVCGSPLEAARRVFGSVPPL
jgi:hypothetical protein